ncbi:Flp family type IVb pilin [Hoeflea sp. YIM 152468]|uniref:Flp family type IVb pilin n=1 Tax=Hoeflea sp. YIM 152468 TaxID=3031759 RepID=UPI0023DC3225|nr:Flp family type IVb pilin [Hoeflea sp. YIM 152468]MDF1608019.1 Flp family type IVb pilin [Hoeflea sp. YIM 152468]
MKLLFRRFVQDTSGVTAVEYGLISAMIAIALIAAATTLGETINSTLDGAAGHLRNSQ